MSENSEKLVPKSLMFLCLLGLSLTAQFVDGRADERLRLSRSSPLKRLARPEPKLPTEANSLPFDRSLDDGAIFAALMDLFNSTSGNSRSGWTWSNSTNWGSAKISYCQWFGVTCDENHQILWLALGGNDLSGTIPESIGVFNSLTILDFSNNYLQGTLPESIGKLINLQSLWIYQNQLTGSFPSSLGNCVNLINLHAGDNNFSGSIPTSFSQLTRLETIDLSHNKLSGPLSDTFFRDWTDLTTLDLDSNFLTGSFPSSIEQSSQLQYFSLVNNQFSGPFPSEAFQYMTQLNLLWLANNEFTGPIPSSITNCTALQYLWLDQNQFTGNLDFLYPLKQLQYASLSHNQLTGDVPKWLGSNTVHGLTRLSLDHNELTGSWEEIPFNVANLESFVIDHNQFTGSFPSFLCDPELVTLRNFNFLSLSANQFSGPLLSSCITPLLTNLFMLNISSNQFSGPFPSLPPVAANLGTLDISFNQFSAFNFSIPPNSGLQSLWMKHNRITSSIERPIPVQIQSIDLSYNQIPGTGKELLYLLDSATLTLDITNNQFQGDLILFDSLLLPLNVFLSYNQLTHIETHSNVTMFHQCDFSNNPFDCPLAQWLSQDCQARCSNRD